MRRTRRLLIAATAAGTAGCGLLAGTSAVSLATQSSARAASATKVELRHTRLGSILTTSSGLTLYLFTRDRRDEDSCAKVSGCLRAWPALETSSQPSAGPGVKASLLSTIRISGGARQVTYDGHALYTFAGDTPGDVSYVGEDGFGGDWDAVSASGAAVK